MSRIPVVRDILSRTRLAYAPMVRYLSMVRGLQPRTSLCGFATRLLCVALLVHLAVPSLAATHPAEVIQITAEGEALADKPDARDHAIADALRNAVMEAVGTYVDATTIGSNYQVVRNEIVLKSAGFATLDGVESTTVKNGVLRVRVKASVSNRPLADRLRDLGLMHEWRVGVSIRGEGGKSAENAVIGKLVSAGYRVLDESRRKRLAADEAAMRAADGGPAALAAIRREYAVDVFVSGEAVAETLDGSSEGGVSFYRNRGRIEARAYYTDTAEVVTVRDSEAEALDQSESLSAAHSLKKAGERIGTTLADDLTIAPASANPFVVVKVTNLKKLASAAAFESALKMLPGVSQVKRHRYSSGTLELNVYMKSEFRDELPERVESCGVGEKLGITVDAWSKTFLLGRVTKG